MDIRRLNVHVQDNALDSQFTAKRAKVWKRHEKNLQRE